MTTDIADAHASPQPSVVLVAHATHVTNSHGEFAVYAATHDGVVHAVLVRGDVAGRENVVCRVASACVMSTALDSAECDCGIQLAVAMDRIRHHHDGGVLIYLVDQEGRGHGLACKVRALRNKNAGMDTFAAVEELGLPSDVRDYAVVRKILDALDIVSVTLLSNNPDKRIELEAVGVKVSQMQALEVDAPRHAWRHMQAKKDRGHTLTNAYMECVDGAVATPGETAAHSSAERDGHTHDGASSSSQ